MRISKVSLCIIRFRSNSLDALHVFAEHRSIRFFERKPLAPGDLDLIIEAGRRAPTDAQGHMYAFVRITDAGLRDRLATLCANQQHIRDAAEFFVACLDVFRLRRLIEHRGGEWGMEARIALLYGATDATMVAQNMVVAAEMLQYGTCYIGAVQNHTDAIAAALGVAGRRTALVWPVHWVVDQERRPPVRPRIPRSLCFVENRYPEAFTADELESAYGAMSVKRDWYASDRRLFYAGRYDAKA